MHAAVLSSMREVINCCDTRAYQVRRSYTKRTPHICHPSPTASPPEEQEHNTIGSCLVRHLGLVSRAEQTLLAGFFSPGPKHMVAVTA